MTRLPDLSSQPFKVRAERTIRLPPETVYRAWDPQHAEAWPQVLEQLEARMAASA